ncbi:hypothetical protein SARC_01602 [Sphaeroforma arctica JP610]|uniref:NAD-dependent epimerase/dehydratase domain-containing protein n=1 Tax=Sphaeroforma arctica JP610 TaxID=667725 RepID=A0A0L0GBA4_9EUKA|nr:hypothetical protein SARC_01602 [Sphaeroforma arctica JP610]KNC86280.1 hypothetical protein SARC_01602 [Sphaeroforma arctica JP610]|eukprot:XP_014160182.1 hypothetical protein SARC_01602 [Sphaeroforma arctica JP610]
MVQTVLVTGASGFIALHIVEKLLKEGNFKIRGTVRDVNNKEKCKPIYDLVKDPKYPIELVHADLGEDKGWKEAVEGVDLVLHTASPFFFADPEKSEEELIRPAVDGTKRVMEACAAEGSKVQRCIVTSSLASIMGCEKPEGHIFTEKDWSDPEQCDGYRLSKTLAEKTAWDFVKSNKGHTFELATINPSMVIGPVRGRPGTSVNMVKAMMKGEKPQMVGIGFVDVREVAEAHVKALTMPEAVGERFMLSADNLLMKDAAEWIKEVYESKGYGPFDYINEMEGDRKKIPKLADGSKVTTVMDVKYHDLKQSVLDTCESLIQNGLVKPE